MLGVVVEPLDFYQRLGAKNYELVIRGLNWNGPEHMRRALSGLNLRGAKVADLGIGTGQLSDIFRAHSVGEITGIDGVTEFLTEAMDTGRADKTILSDLIKGRIPLHSETVDLVTASGLFAYMSDPAPLLAEMLRVTKNGGHIAFNFHPSATSAGSSSERVNAAAVMQTRAVYTMHHHSQLRLTGFMTLSGCKTVALRQEAHGVKRFSDESWIPLVTCVYRKAGGLPRVRANRPS